MTVMAIKKARLISESGFVPREGIEPSLCCQNWILNPARLPIPPPGPEDFPLKNGLRKYTLRPNEKADSCDSAKKCLAL